MTYKNTWYIVKEKNHVLAELANFEIENHLTL